jgi:diaminopimelate epimerase
VLVKGGDTLSVDFLRSRAGFSHVILTGPADFVFEGDIAL